MEWTETPALWRKPAGAPKSPFLWPPRQRPTLQMRNVLDELPREQHVQVVNVMPRGVEVDRRRRGDEAARKPGPLSGTRLRNGGPQPARGDGREVHDPAFEASAFVIQMPGYDQRHREPAERRSKADEQCHQMARRGHGRTLGSLGVATHREAFPEGR